MQSDNIKLKKEFKQRLYTFVLRLLKFVSTLNIKDPIVRVIVDQLTRSGCSILANYIEGLASSSKKEFIVFFNHSLKSSNESKVWIALLRDTNRCDIKEANYLLAELDEISKIFASSILTLKGKR